MKTKKLCQSCFKGELKHRTKAVTYRFKGRSIVIEQPGEWCNYCDEGVLG